ncbi:hypothetical protein U8Q06_20855 [Rhizobium beringeri]|uniref:hypothetical protein n=1 Tax=Rhizobium beringeri TaxID=3019934 RepID=UPI002E10148F|nr:hypothetical protein U8Q06_20855 [Rhizobium beringeri]
MEIAFEAQAISQTIAAALERIAESTVHDPNELHRLSRIANSCSRLLNDIAAEIEDASTELEGLRRADAAAVSGGRPSQ